MDSIGQRKSVVKVLIMLALLAAICFSWTNIHDQFTLKAPPLTTPSPPEEVPVRKHDDLGIFDVQMPLLSNHSNEMSLYPNASHPWLDRILQQLAYVPLTKPKRLKTILVTGGGYGLTAVGRRTFLDLQCKVNECLVTTNTSNALTADLVLLTNDLDISLPIIETLLNKPRRTDQVWAFYMRESPHHLKNIFGHIEFNWTVSYTPWSTIPVPYGKFYPITSGVTTLPQTRNYAEGKTGKVLWIVSNCCSSNKRLEYAREMAKYISVDIYGKCGMPIKGRYLGGNMQRMLEQYKFYLAFENSDCDTYVTEKYFRSALSNDILPVVMGARKEYYKLISPPNSHIHINSFHSAKQLANYLHVLDKNDTLYNSYFRWKGAWRLVPERGILCQFCAMLHAPKRSIVNTFDKWRRTEPCLWKQRCRGSIFPHRFILMCCIILLVCFALRLSKSYGYCADLSYRGICRLILKEKISRYWYQY